MGNGAVVALSLGFILIFLMGSAALFKNLISPAALFSKVWSRDRAQTSHLRAGALL